VVQQAPLVFRSVFFLRDFNEDKGSWAVASYATTGGGASLFYFDAAVWLSSASSPLFLYGPLFLLFVFVFFVSSMWVCLCCPSRRVLWSPCRSYWFFIGATCIPPKSNPRGGWGSSFSYFTFVVFFSCLRFFDVGVHTGRFCSWSSRKIVVGTTTEGGMARFRLRFRVCLCPVLKSAHQKVQKSSLLTPCYMQKTKQDMMYIRQPIFSYLLWFLSYRCLVLSLLFLTLINLHAK